MKDHGKLSPSHFIVGKVGTIKWSLHLTSLYVVTITFRPKKHARKTVLSDKNFERFQI